MKYNAEIQVTDYHPEIIGGEEEVRASRFGDFEDEWSKTRKFVEDYQKRFKIGGEYRCWIRDGDIRNVRLDSGAKPDRWWSLRLILATSLSLVFVGVVVFVLRKEIVPAVVRRKVGGWVEMIMNTPAMTVIRLSPYNCEIEGKEVKKAIQSLEVGQKGLEGEIDRSKWNCCICLENGNSTGNEVGSGNDRKDGGDEGVEEGGTANDFDKSIVALPCGNNHFVHAGCIFEWLQKGGSTCPLCGYQVSTYIKAASEPSSEADLRALRRVSRSDARVESGTREGNEASAAAGAPSSNAETRITLDPCG